MHNQGPVSDRDAGFEVTDSFERFSQKYDVFRRTFWDDRVRTKKSERFYQTYRAVLDTWRAADGFTQRDYALRNASWHVSDLFTEYKEGEDRREGFTDAFTLQRAEAPERLEFESPVRASAEVKRVARAFGADLVGIAAVDPRWMYTEKFSDLSGTARPNDIPADLPNVIVTAQAMDHELIRTAPSALSGAATGVGYSRDALVVLSLAQYLRNLGYRAVASMNDSSLAIPMAIQAGLGEYSRLGLLITREFGPRVRLGKVFTDLPLSHDAPIRFGVREFCEVCRRCAEACPVGAIPAGPPSTERLNESNLKGVRKWSVDGETCFGFWAAMNSDCAICMRVCPYNKDYTRWWARLGQRLAGTPLRRLMRWLDVKMGFGERRKPGQWWTAMVILLSASVLGCSPAQSPPPVHESELFDLVEVTPGVYFTPVREGISPSRYAASVIVLRGDHVLVVPDRLVEDVLELDDGPLVRVIHVGPAHTPGDIVVHLPEQGVLAIGDLVEDGFPWFGDGTPAGWARAMDRVADLDATILLPAHGPVLRDRDREMFETQRAFIRALVESAARAAEVGGGAEDVIARGDLADFEGHFTRRLADLPEAERRERYERFLQEILAWAIEEAVGLLAGTGG